MIAACNTHAAEAPRASYRPVLGAIDVTSVFYICYFGHVFTFFNVYFPNVFYLKKNVGKVQSSKQINKKHFQNNSNEIDL